MRSRVLSTASLAFVMGLFCLACGGSDDTEQADSGASITPTGDGMGTTGDTVAPSADGIVPPKSDAVPPPEDTGPAGCQVPAGMECDPVCHAGCGEEEACFFTSDNGWGCYPKGSKFTGQACATTSDCRGGACVTSTSGGARCLPACLTDADCVVPQACIAQVAGAEPYGFCDVPTPNCIPVEEGACAVGEACYVVQSGTQCLPAGTKSVSEECSGSNDCAPGLSCLTLNGASGCVRLCSTKGSEDALPIGCFTMCGGVATYQEIDAATKTGYCMGDLKVENCSPLDQNCGPAKGCYDTSDGWVCLTAGSGDAGEQCIDPSDCEVGLFCLNSKCKIICDPSQATNNPKCASFEIACVSVGGGAGYCDQ